MNPNHPIVKRVSEVISNFFNPIVSLLIYFFYYSYHNLDKKELIDFLLPILFIVIIPSTLWIIINVKTGRYTNMDVSNRKQRHSLYIVLISLLSFYLGYEYFVKNNVDYRLVYLTVLIILMQISNFFIKSSMHTSLNFFVAALFFEVKPIFGFLWLILAVVIGITRIILKRHTVAEVISGAVIASVVSLIYLIL